MKKCSQCGYKRDPVEDQYLPLSECPKCGALYREGDSEDSARLEGPEEPRQLNGSPLHPPLIYVGFWRRVAATIIDSVFFFFAGGFVAGIMMLAHPLLPSPREPVGNFLLSFVFPVIVTLAFWFKYLATPGKMAISAIIVDARTGGAPSKSQFVGRYVAYALSAIFLMLGFLWVAFDSRKQGWHDKLAGTLVVRKPRMYSAEP